ncbi:hypothetical protein HL658_09150 [Azospirillum sp. RWY-5-1]|uniref:Uncharacterized protein n=1 Tax=Azospirillum oleiclasticum TaxID=2735135 RepID=A0ABX2T6C6_9PROT|nr:hypothetical protein [Azospirillum oleiclasticum]NYZ12717.1 hypothetical protein [Azospirillum oleiclasticum]NYZ19877.1 hypothetical protein [Azospirillum oleiclasticum]
MTTDDDTRAAARPGSYSRAFENMVQGPDDTAGLLAYALFKQAVREDAMNGTGSVANPRNPSVTTVKVFRDAAEQMLAEVATRAITAAKPDLQRSSIANAITALRDNLQTVQANITNHVTNQTRYRHAIITGVIAWLITIIITAAVLYNFALPNWQDRIVEAVREAQVPTAGSPAGTPQR